MPHILQAPFLGAWAGFTKIALGGKFPSVNERGATDGFFVKITARAKVPAK